MIWEENEENKDVKFEPWNENVPETQPYESGWNND